MVQHFKDDASAFNGIKKGAIVDKGIINNHVSYAIFKYLESQGVKTHLVEELNDREVLTKKLEIIPVEVVMRNVVAGSLAKRTGSCRKGRSSITPSSSFITRATSWATR